MFLFQVYDPAGVTTRTYEGVKKQWDGLKSVGGALKGIFVGKPETVQHEDGRDLPIKKTKEYKAADGILNKYKNELTFGYSKAGKLELLDKGVVNPNFEGIPATEQEVIAGSPRVYALAEKQLLALQKDNGKIRFSPPVDPAAANSASAIAQGKLPPAPSLAKITIPPDVAGGKSIELNPEVRPVLADLVKSMNQYAASNGLTFTQTLKGSVATITVNGPSSFGADAKGTFTLDATKFDSKEDKENKKYMIDVLDAFETIAKKTAPLKK